MDGGVGSDTLNFWQFGRPKKKTDCQENKCYLVGLMHRLNNHVLQRPHVKAVHLFFLSYTDIHQFKLPSEKLLAKNQYKKNTKERPVYLARTLDDVFQGSEGIHFFFVVFLALVLLGVDVSFR